MKKNLLFIILCLFGQNIFGASLFLTEVWKSGTILQQQDVFFLACKEGQDALVAELLQLCTAQEAPFMFSYYSEEDKKTSLMIAIQRGYIEIAKMLLEAMLNKDFRNVGTYINFYNENGFTALHYAVALGNEDLVVRLLSLGADVNCINTAKETPLHQAVKRGNISLVKRLVAAKANLEEKSIGGKSILHLAVESRSVAVVKYLLAQKVNPYYLSSDGKGAVHWAAMQGNNEIIKLFLQEGVSSNTFDRSKKTPLHYAVLYDKYETIEFLLSQGASLSFRDEKDKTPLDYAAQKGDLQLAIMLLSHDEKAFGHEDEKGRTFLFTALEYKKDDFFLSFLKIYGSKRLLLKRTFQGHTLLSYAIMHERKKVIIALLMLHIQYHIYDYYASALVRQLRYTEVYPIFEGYEKTCLNFCTKESVYGYEDILV